MKESGASVAGKRVIVTGGSAGLGLAMARALAEGGAQVVITGRHAKRGQAALRDIPPPGAARFLEHDAAAVEGWPAMFDGALQALGGLDALINNVGANEVKSIDTTTYEDFMRMARVNLYSAWCGISQALRVMASGSIVNLASVAALYANPAVAPYCVAKAMVGGLSRAAAAELAPRGIRVNAIYPGMFMTEMSENLGLFADARRETYLAGIPLRRFGDPAELGALACFLVSDASAGITGADFIVDGGRTAL